MDHPWLASQEPHRPYIATNCEIKIMDMDNYLLKWDEIDKAKDKYTATKD